MGKIIWLASYPKSGNSWVRAFLQNYIRNSSTPENINALTDFSAVECAAAFFPNPAADNAQIQRDRRTVHEALTRLHPDLVFVKTHNANMNIHNIPLCTPSVTAGALHIVRDPRDLALSYAAYLSQPVDSIIAFMANPKAANRTTELQVFEYLSSWSAHTDSWLAAPRTLTIRYEDLVATPTETFGRIIAALGDGTVDEARLTRAISHSHFEILAAQERTSGYNAAGPAPEKFFRAGKPGEWRTRLTAAQSATITTSHAPTMKKLGYL
jgi:hypothetical protein